MRDGVEIALPTAIPGFAVIDLETTGLSPSSDRIVEIAILTTDPSGRVLNEWCSRINPQRPVGATHVHGLTDDDVQCAPTFGAVAETVATLLSARAMVAHNAPFDTAFLQSEFERAGWSWARRPTLCTLEASDYYLPFLERRRLADCCYACGIGLFDEHSALGDARAVAQLLTLFLHPAWGPLPLPEHLALPDRAIYAAQPERSGVPWPPSGTAGAATGRGRRAHRAEPHRFRTLGPLLDDFAMGEFKVAANAREALAYLEVLAEALEDGELSSGELRALGDVASVYQLSMSDVLALHAQFIEALADKAVEDQFVSKAERQDLVAAAALLELDSAAIEASLERAERTRQAMLSARCRPLPDGWPHGEPLHLGDRIAFTGCDPDQREHLERASTTAGLRLTGSVSRRTAALVTDGSYQGNKAEAARVLGTRIIRPNDLQSFLDHVQPARPVPHRSTVLPRPAAGTLPGAAMPPLDPAAVRAWAQDQGMITGTRGRLSRDVVEAFIRAEAPDA